MTVQTACGSLVAIVLVVMAAAQAQAGPKVPATKRVFEVLDLSQRGLAEVKRLHEAGDDEAACRALHNYIRTTEWNQRTAGNEAKPGKRDPDYSDPVADDLPKNVFNNVKITHTRSIFFARPDYCVVIDRLTPGDEREHEYRMKYQLSYLLDPHAEAARVTAVSDTAGIVVEPLGSGITLSIIKGQKRPYYEGWHYARGFKPAPALIYTWKTKGMSCIQTLLYPFAAGASGARKVRASVERAGNGAVVLTITGHQPNTTDHLLIGGENRVCRGGGYGLNGALAFIRKSGDETIGAGMVDGTSLTGEAPVFTFETPTSAWAQRQPDGAWRRSTDGPPVE